MTQQTLSETTHPWERAGLGAAPYRCVGHTVEKYQACPGAPVQVGTCCDYCGTGIMDTFWIRSADGNRFKVGSSCVRKTNRSGTKVLSEMEQLRRKAQRERRHLREAARDEHTREELGNETTRAKLAAEPHPNKWRAEQGATLLDWCEWTMKNAGAQGRGRVAKTLGKIS